MVSDATAAIIVAGISGALSVATALFAAWAGQHSAAQQDKRHAEAERIRGIEAGKLRELDERQATKLRELGHKQDECLLEIQSDQAKELQRFQSEQAEKLQLLRAGQELALANLRSEQETRLARLRQDLLDTHDREAQASEAAKLVAKYRDPLLRSAYDVQSRIYNIYERGFRGGADDEGYFRDNTLYVLAEFLGWLEILRREMQFLDLGAEETTRKLRLCLDRIQGVMASRLGSLSESESGDELYVYRGQQRAIGEIMTARIDHRGGAGEGAGATTGGTVAVGRHLECIGYATFVSLQNQPDFAKWFKRLGSAVTRLPAQWPRPDRWVFLQQALIDLIDLLDRMSSGFPIGTNASGCAVEMVALRRMERKR
ncbi:hypothetical protein EHS25_004200 [Saitozyma podzolica]|uniref:Uncharacterized protein n=1 Tax=Saitozyma podzolica TaxID=1890683 RepID=A0A427YTI9_9TREE|nr:hypothetical protein EHS25_004200 [Saitozyma podzolica]